MRHCGENEIPIFFLWKMRLSSKIRFFSRKSEFFYRKSEFFIKNPIFFIKNPDFFENIRKWGGGPLLYTTFRKHTKSGVWSLSEFPCFIVYAARSMYLQYLTQCGVKPGLYSVRRSTQTELRKRIYADTCIMAFILLRRSRRVCTGIVGVFTLGIMRDPYRVDRHW